MTADNYSVTPSSALTGAVPTRKSENDLGGQSARRRPGRRRPSRDPDASSKAFDPAEAGPEPAGTERTPPDKDGESHVDCFI
jgi:hypothetical protein